MRYAFSKGHFVLIGGELEWTQKNSYDSRTNQENQQGIEQEHRMHSCAGLRQNQIPEFQ